jgi:hypothetical protein
MPIIIPEQYWIDLKPYAGTDAQDKAIDALIQCGTYAAAAEQIGISERVLFRTVKRVKARAARKGHAPEHSMTRTVPDGFMLKGATTLWNVAENRAIIQWVKADQDKERQLEIMHEIIDEMKEGVTPRKPTPPPKQQTQADLLNLFIITDYHLGMLAWAEETRDDDWDTDLAEQLLYDWIDYSILHAPDASVGVFGQLGDFLHWDGLTAATPASGHVLDADTRFQKVVRVAIRATHRVIDAMLAKHDKVIVLMAEGNHDPASSIWLREMYSHFLAKEPRIEVIVDPDPYYCIEHGLTSIFLHHGHKKRMSEIDRAFTAKFRETFGRTKYSYAHMGHYHHVKSEETSLMIVEQHPTLASSDAYASRGGWMAMRSAPVITYSKEHGEVGRLQVKPSMLTKK